MERRGRDEGIGEVIVRRSRAMLRVEGVGEGVLAVWVLSNSPL